MELGPLLNQYGLQPGAQGMQQPMGAGGGLLPQIAPQAQGMGLLPLLVTAAENPAQRSILTDGSTLTGQVSRQGRAQRRGSARQLRRHNEYLQSKSSPRQPPGCVRFSC